MPLELFISYSHKDDEFRKDLDTHLSTLKRQGVIDAWHDRRIAPGTEWADDIALHLESAQIILLLISADFIASNYCYDKEMTRALERHERREARVIPIILRPCDWQTAEFSKLQALPQDAKPITTWANRDEAFLNVALGIRRVVQEMTGDAPRRASQVKRDTLPILNVTEYIVRGIEDQVRERLQRDGAAAIVGIRAPGGVGKTELAKYVVRQIAHEYAEWKLIDIGKKDPDQIVGDMALACGFTLSPNANYAQRVAELRDRLESRHILFILDDVREKNRRALDDILPPPPCAAIVTSRIQTLSQKIHPNQSFELDAMTDAEARALLIATLGDARINAEPPAVVRIIARCKGNALALDIAARCILRYSSSNKPMTIYADKLDRRLSELKAGVGARLDFEEVIDASYAELNDADKKRFRALAVFAPSGFTAPAAQAVWNDSADDATRAINHLLDLSLIKAVQADDERYRLHDLLDEYADKVLEKCGETNEANDRHAQYLVQFFGEHYVPNEIDLELGRLEIENLRAAVRWARATQNGKRLAELATQPRNWLTVLSLHAEWYEWLQIALRVGKDYEPALQANVLQAIGDVQ